MAEDVVVKEGLSDAMIQAGAELTRKLDDMEWPVVASLWFYSSDSNQWRLLFASPRVDEEGPPKAYQHIRNALQELPENIPTVALQNIAVMDSSHPLISLLRTAVRTGESISGIRFTDNVVNGQLIEGAYIYRMQ